MVMSMGCSVSRATMNKKELHALDEGAVIETSQTDKHIWPSLWKLKVTPCWGT